MASQMKVVFIVLAFFCGEALSQANLVRIRGNVESFDGKVLNVKARSGQSYAVKVPDNLLVIGVNKASVADITKDKYVGDARLVDRKSTRLNSSHTVISYAVFCLK